MTQKFSIKGFADNSITGEKIAGFTSATDGFVITKSSGSLTWAQAADPNPTMGGDLTGLASNAQIAANAVGVAELNVTVGTAGQALTIDGGGTLGFTTIVTDPTMGGDMTGTASNAQIAADAVGTAEIATGAVGTTEIAAGAVTGTEIVNGAITELKIHSSVNLGGPSVGTNSLIRTNSQDVNEDVTISNTTNGLSAGPVEVLTGWTVTVEGNWTVI